jgi:hypothetical protein
MAEQRVPDLEEMDEQEAQHFLADLFSRLSAEAEDRIRHEDYTMEMPQSGERIRGRQKMREFQVAQSRPPRQLRRVLVRDGLWVVEGIIDYGGKKRLLPRTATRSVEGVCEP